MPSTSWRAYFPAVTKEKYLEVRPSSSVFITTQKLGGKSKEFVLKKKDGRFGHTVACKLNMKMLILPEKSALLLGPLGLDKN